MSRGYDIFNNVYVVQQREADAEPSEAAASVCGLGELLASIRYHVVGNDEMTRLKNPLLRGDVLP